MTVGQSMQNFAKIPSMPERQGEEKSDTEKECPFVSQRVVCGLCGSPNFSIDPQAPTKRNKVGGRCDDCGYTEGTKMK